MRREDGVNPRRLGVEMFEQRLIFIRNRIVHNGVIAAVLGMSYIATRIWWYTLVRSILENMWVHCSPDANHEYEALGSN